MMIANLTALIRLANDDAMKNRIIVLQGVIFNVAVSLAALFLNTLSPTQLLIMFKLLGLGLFLSSWLTFNMPSNNKSSQRRVGKDNFKKVSYKTLLMLLPMVACYGLIFSIVKTYFAVDTAARFSSPLLVWLVLSANPILVLFVQPALVGALKNKSDSLLLGVGGGLLCLGYYLFGISNLLIPSLLFIAIASVGEMVFAPISKKLAAGSLGEGNEGMGLALWKTSYYVAGIFGASYSGYVGHSYGHHYAWAICLPLFFIILVCSGYSVIGRHMKSTVVVS